MQAVKAVEDWFEQDMRAYLAVLPQLLESDEGKFALIAKAEFSSVHDSREAAMERGYQKFGLSGFLVQEISRRDLELGQFWLNACHY